MDRLELDSLLKKYRLGKLSDEEEQQLRSFLDTEEAPELLSEVWDKSFDALAMEESSESKEGTFRRVMSDERLTVQQNNTVSGVQSLSAKRQWIVIAAASIALAVLAGSIWSFVRQQSDRTEMFADNSQGINPGSDRARIVFDDGSFIELDKLQEDTVLLDKSLQIFKREDGTISYAYKGEVPEQTLIYNTIVTPNGGEYSLVLPDGSQVWVNAASQLRYPLTFAADSREVELEGEAFFEVKQQIRDGSRVPFIVHTGDQRLEVLGTSFNINSYSKNITTTLVEGSVALTYPHTETVQYLKPSQQSSYSKFDQKLQVTAIDPHYATAWRTGSFAFDNASIYDVMDDVARWYDIEVQYEGDLSDVRYNGTISRFENFKQLLQIIEWTDLVTFNVEGRRVIVMK